MEDILNKLRDQTVKESTQSRAWKQSIWADRSMIRRQKSDNAWSFDYGYNFKGRMII